MAELARAVGVDDAAVADLLERLSAAGLTVATAESLTGGLLVALLTEIPGSSAVVRGGLVVYATDLKHTLAGVDSALLTERGPVDPEVAMRLADGARSRCGASIGVGLTGVAGPDPQNGVPVGTWFCAVSGPGDHRDARSAHSAATPSVDGHPAGQPDAAGSVRRSTRAAAARAALEMLANIPATLS
ncbi:CinA family protein [Nakamurella sp. GG22]